MAKSKGGLAILIAGKPAKGKPPEEDEMSDMMDEDFPDEETADEEAAEYPTFQVPSGLDLSEMQPGEEKEVMASIRINDDGTATITKIEGVDLAGGPEEEAEPLLEEEAPPPAQGGISPDAIRSRAMSGGLM